MILYEQIRCWLQITIMQGLAISLMYLEGWGQLCYDRMKN